ncbi:MAG: glycosyltransferase [Gemmataceae bacterium]
MSIAVVICTWNRAALLDQTLCRMRELEPPGEPWELLVVNNASTDDTDAVVAKHTGALPVRRLFEPTPGQSNARNCGLANTRADWVVWTDDDVQVAPGWLAAFAATARRHPHAAAVGGPIDPWFPAPPDPDLVKVFPILGTGFIGIDYGPDEKPLGPDEPIWGANMAYSTAATAGMRFNPNLGRVGAGLVSGDDADFLARVRATGGAVVYSPGMRLRHYVEPKRMTEEYLLGFYEGLGVTAARMGQIPAGRSVRGLPLWVVRRWIEARLAAVVHRLRGARVPRLLSMRDYRRCRGMIRGVLAGGAGA